MKRRGFIKKTAAAGVILGLNPIFSCSSTKTKLKILVLGGTYFVGPSIVNAAIQNKHSVTLFNRGITNPKLFPKLNFIYGDRKLGMEAYVPLQKEQWDVVIDVWPQKSKLVDEATRALMHHTKHYIFVSSIAVYRDFEQVGLNEQYKVVNLDLKKREWDYPEEKLASELFVKDRFKNNHTILRAGPIKGWRDPALDLLYWCIKLNRDAKIVAPGSGMDHLQFIDVKDVGRFAVSALENKLLGTYNCTGPKKEALVWKDFLDNAKRQFNSQTELVWANEDFLRTNKVSSFGNLPLWTPLSEDGFMQISNTKMIQTGFVFTPIHETLNDCIRWYRNNMDTTLKFGTDMIDLGLERTRELKLIDKLKT